MNIRIVAMPVLAILLALRLAAQMDDPYAFDENPPARGELLLAGTVRSAEGALMFKLTGWLGPLGELRFMCGFPAAGDAPVVEVPDIYGRVACVPRKSASGQGSISIYWLPEELIGKLALDAAHAGLKLEYQHVPPEMKAGWLTGYTADGGRFDGSLYLEYLHPALR
jgi:hypothetical protein